MSILRLSFWSDSYQPTSIGGSDLNYSGLEDSVTKDVVNVENLFSGAPKSDKKLNKSDDRNFHFPPGSVLGIDFDDTLTLSPKDFKNIIDEVRECGGKCHIITARPNSEADVVEGFCSKHGITVDSTHFYPNEYSYEDYLKNVDRWDARAGRWKSIVAKHLGITVMIDDKAACLRAIGKENPGTVLMKPEEI